MCVSIAVVSKSCIWSALTYRYRRQISPAGQPAVSHRRDTLPMEFPSSWRLRPLYLLVFKQYRASKSWCRCTAGYAEAEDLVIVEKSLRQVDCHSPLPVRFIARRWIRLFPDENSTLREAYIQPPTVGGNRKVKIDVNSINYQMRCFKLKILRGRRATASSCRMCNSLV